MTKNKNRWVILVVIFASALLGTIDLSAQQTLQKINDRRNFVATPKGFGMPIRKVEYSDAIDKGILRCQKGRMGILINCVVRNMPLFLQTDPRLDTDVTEMGPNGCFDTSIATLIITALANRTSTQPLKGRTKQFADVPASATAPKEIEQLSWFYRTAKKAANGVKDVNGRAIQSLYLSEVLADLGKINESCNPYTFAECKSATNPFGHSFYIYSNGETWTNEYVTKKMRDGYVLFIAYARYTPFIVVEKNRKVVKFAPAGVHKVVVSGFQLDHKYPLLINDVGNGQQFRVRLGTDLSSRKFALSGSTRAETFGEADFRYPPEVKTSSFMEYEGAANGINDQVQFIVHLDAIKLN
jgi:hypothetical protein